MSLRRQLLLVSLLLISLPWAGCQYVREMEAALQSGQEQALLATARAVATVLADKPGLLFTDPDPARRQEAAEPEQQLYASAASAPLIIDGYADGWERSAQTSFGPVSYTARSHGSMLYLLFTVQDSEVVYHDPRQNRRASGDRLVLRSGRGINYVIATAAPGSVQARIEQKSGAMRYEPRIRGFWQDSLEGFTIELELPLALLDQRLGFYLVQDSGVASTGVASSVGNYSPRKRRLPPRLIYPPPNLQQALAPFGDQGLELQIVDRQRWILARTEDQQLDLAQAGAAKPAQQSHWLLRAFYRAILNGTAMPAAAEATRFGQSAAAELDTALAGSASAGWYAAPDSTGFKLLTAAAPISNKGEVLAVVLARQNSEQYLSLTDRAFSRLLYYSLTALLIAALGLLGYASLLSWRIRRLSKASARVINPDGSLNDDFPVSRSRDEIGEMSRQYAELLSRLRDYTDYLRTLSRKLSHELRTPIAVIQSSLDNLEAGKEADSEVYVQRAREGLGRLANILTAMSEATRLEESVHNNQAEDFDLVLLCRDLFAAYQGLYTEQQLTLLCELDSQPMHGVPELLAQMLDKLMDNAASFAPAGGKITLQLKSAAPDRVELSVSNEGPLLPAAMQQQLFDSMVSVRDKSERVHLGLGLHIVKLIVDFHGGSARAENLADGSGVRFVLELPLVRVD
ncbi:MAG: ATP-binding protein [Halieaceae bacterium]